MTDKSFEPSDPMALVGVNLEREPDHDALTEMARCFAEEYARMGWSGQRIFRLFQNPFYRGPHQALRALGEEPIRNLIDAVGRLRGARHGSDTTA